MPMKTTGASLRPKPTNISIRSQLTANGEELPAPCYIPVLFARLRHNAARIACIESENADVHGQA